MSSPLALLIGAKPRKDRIGSIVRVEQGRYRARLENVQDSVIMLCSVMGIVDRLMEGVEFLLESGDYHTLITSAGKEQHINVSLERIF